MPAQLVHLAPQFLLPLLLVLQDFSVLKEKLLALNAQQGTLVLRKQPYLCNVVLENSQQQVQLHALLAQMETNARRSMVLQWLAQELITKMELTLTCVPLVPSVLNARRLQLPPVVPTLTEMLLSQLAPPEPTISSMLLLLSISL